MYSTIKSIKNQLGKLMYILDRQQKAYGVLVLVCSFVGAVFEVLGVGIILPLVEAFLNPQQLMQSEWLKGPIEWFHIDDTQADRLIIILTLAVIGIFVLKNVYFIFLSWLRIKYSCKVSRELSTRMMSGYMKRGYEFFLTMNTAELTRNIGADVSGVDTIIHQMLRVLVDGLTILLIVVYVFVTDIFMALAMVVLALICLVLIYGVFRVKMREAGEHYNKFSGITGKYLLQALHGIKEILVMRKQDYFVQHYEDANVEKQKGAIRQTVGVESPAYIIEGVCVMGLLSAVCIRLIINQQSAVEMVPALSAFAVGAFRILPSLGRISSAMNTAIYYMPSLGHVYENMAEMKKYSDENAGRPENGSAEENIAFLDELVLENISWHYKNTEKYVIRDLNMRIAKGSSVAFVGQSGAGKTTLADIILGLLYPQQGRILIDGKDLSGFRNCSVNLMGYVPQSVYLTDDTIRNNVAFGVEAAQIDDERVWSALEQAQLKEFVSNLEQGLDTYVGDRGIRFSGGQRQRIAIARVLYENPDIIIFDEATAALDNETELAVMDSIRALQGHKTLIIIAHRLTTIKECDVIYEIKDGNATVRTYEELTREV